jgi:hypothetical protein
MLIKTSVLSLSLALFIGVAAAQAPSWPIVEGRHLQPTQQQVVSRGNDWARQWRRVVQSAADRLYDEIMRGSALALDGPGARPARSSGVREPSLEAGETR